MRVKQEPRRESQEREKDKERGGEKDREKESRERTDEEGQVKQYGLTYLKGKVSFEPLKQHAFTRPFFLKNASTVYTTHTHYCHISAKHGCAFSVGMFVIILVTIFAFASCHPCTSNSTFKHALSAFFSAFFSLICTRRTHYVPQANTHYLCMLCFDITIAVLPPSGSHFCPALSFHLHFLPLSLQHSLQHHLSSHFLSLFCSFFFSSHTCMHAHTHLCTPYTV